MRGMSEGGENDAPSSDPNPDFGNKGFRNVQRRLVFPGRMAMLALVAWMLLGVFMGQRNTADAVFRTSALSATQVEELKKYLEATNPEYTSYSYDQLKQWFENQTPDHFKWEVYPRLYPFCVTAKQINDSGRTRKNEYLRNFSAIFNEMERVDEKFYNFDAQKHSQYFRKDWIKSIKLSRINTPELDMVNLRQWLHITVTATEDLKGLYMQSIVGPMGLPFGEFFLEFPCKDKKDETDDMATVGQLSYCSYRPKTTIQHPSVYVALDPNGRKTFHMHFFWTDITCMETPYLQFLILAVRDFQYNDTVLIPKLGINYMPLLSPIYLNTDFDSKSGAPFPYYPEWRNNMYCFLDNTTFNATYENDFPGYDDSASDPLNPIKNKWPSTKDGADQYFADIDWKEDSETFRIQANEVYDSCLTGKLADMSRRDEERLECPPGPFRCDTTYAGPNTTRGQVTEQRKKLVENERVVSKCVPCGAPPCTDLGFPDYKCDNLPDELHIDVNESTELNTVETIIRGKTHGVQAMFAFLVLIPIANFMARFYKEICGKCLCDNGPWIFVHIVSHIISILFMWLSVGPVMPRLAEINQQRKECQAQFRGNKAKIKECILEQSVDNPHVGIAILAFIMQHCLVLLGFWRSGSPKFRTIQVALHSHFGYCCWILGAISAIVATAGDICPDVLVMCILLFVTPFIFSAAGVALDCLTDMRVGIMPPRKQWPILEPIKLEGRGPFTTAKWIVFGVYTGLMVFYWIMALGSSFAIVGNSENLFADTKSKVNSIFGEGCVDFKHRIFARENKTAAKAAVAAAKAAKKN